MPSEELLPCPFCGSEAEVVVGEICFTEAFAVYCKECSAKLGVSGRLGEAYEWTPRFYTREAAIEAWNTRAERTCRWKHIEGTWFMSECGERYDRVIPDNYCPSCGAKVV